jgi:hypothetical protein
MMVATHVTLSKSVMCLNSWVLAHVFDHFIVVGSSQIHLITEGIYLSRSYRVILDEARIHKYIT